MKSLPTVGAEPAVTLVS